MRVSFFLFLLTAISIDAVASIQGINSPRAPIGRTNSDFRQLAADEHPHYFLIAADNLARHGDEAGAHANIEKAKNQNLSALELQVFLSSLEPIEGDTTVYSSSLVLNHFFELIEMVMTKHIAELNNGSLENNDETKHELLTLYALAEEYAPDLVGIIGETFADYLGLEIES